MNKRLMKAAVAAVIPFGMLACESPLDPADCEHDATRSATLDAGDLARVHVLAGAGSLQVLGRSDTDVIRVRGRACATSSDLLRQIDIAVERDGEVGEIQAVMPTGFGGGRALLDLVIEVPRALAHTIEDSSGDAEIRNVASVDLTDSSGAVTIEDVAGDVGVVDGSGSVEIARVGGTVRITDGSGDMEVEVVQGDVLIDSDGSGDIRVADVLGDLWVGADGSGSIHFERIGGSVRIP